MENIKEQLEEVIKKNLPEKKEDDGFAQDPSVAFNNGFDEALSQINPSKMADEVLKVVIMEIGKEDNKWNGNGEHYANVREALNNLLSTLSPNKENKSNSRNY